MNPKRCCPAALLLSLLLLAGCQCAHKWNTQDCTAVKTCTLCGAEEGSSPGHTPGAVQQTPDPISGTILTEQFCTACGLSLQRDAVPMETLVENGLYLLTPEEFLQRFSAIAQKYAPDFRFVLSGAEEPLFAKLSWNGTEEALLSFFGPDTAQLTAEDLDRKTLWCLSLSMAGPADTQEALIPDSMVLTLAMACDPAMTEQTVQELYAMKTASLWNTLAYGEPFGYYEAGGLLYEFLHTQNTPMAQPLPSESILVYASNWLAE